VIHPALLRRTAIGSRRMGCRRATEGLPTPSSPWCRKQAPFALRGDRTSPDKAHAKGPSLDLLSISISDTRSCGRNKKVGCIHYKYLSSPLTNTSRKTPLIFMSLCVSCSAKLSSPFLRGRTLNSHHAVFVHTLSPQTPPHPPSLQNNVGGTGPPSQYNHTSFISRACSH